MKGYVWRYVMGWGYGDVRLMALGFGDDVGGLPPMVCVMENASSLFYLDC